MPYLWWLLASLIDRNTVSYKTLRKGSKVAYIELKQALKQLSK